MKHTVGPRPLVESMNSNGVRHGHWYSDLAFLGWIGQYFGVSNERGMCLQQSDIVMEELY